VATLKDLKKSITQMSSEEQFALVKEIRFLRRQAPPKKAKASQKKSISPKAAIAALTKEQKLLLLKELTG